MRLRIKRYFSHERYPDGKWDTNIFWSFSQAFNGNTNNKSFGKVTNLIVSLCTFFCVCFRSKTILENFQLRLVGVFSSFFLCLIKIVPLPEIWTINKNVKCKCKIFRQSVTKCFGNLLFPCNFDSLQAKRNLISRVINFAFELSQELLKELRL